MSGVEHLDVTEGWESRRNKSWSGIRLYDDSDRATQRRTGAIDCVVLHQWGTEVGLSSGAKSRIIRGVSTEEQERAYRMRRVPYHFGAAVTDAGDPVSAQAWPGHLYMHHAGTMNRRSIGVGAMGLFEEVDQSWDYALVQAIQEAVKRAAFEVLRLSPSHYSEGTCAAPVLVLMHSQSTNKPRDPGEQIIKAIAPLVRAGIIKVDPDWSTGKGKPWIEEWRRHVEVSESERDKPDA